MCINIVFFSFMLISVAPVVVVSYIVHPICVKSLYDIHVTFARSNEIRCMRQLVVIMRVYIWLTGLCNLDPLHTFT